MGNEVFTRVLKPDVDYFMNLFYGKNIYEDFPYERIPYQMHGWHSIHPIFETIITEIRPKLIIEVGSWYGASAINMAAICKEQELDTTIICVDTWLGAIVQYEDEEYRKLLSNKNGMPSIYWQFLANVLHKEHDDIIVPLVNTSVIAARFFKRANIQADLIYIDGSHDEEDVYTDMKNYYPLLSANGVIFGDDYFHEDVQNGVKSFLKENSGLVPKVYDNHYFVIEEE